MLSTNKPTMILSACTFSFPPGATENTHFSKWSFLAFDACRFLLLLSQSLQMPNVSTKRLSECVFVIVPDTKFLTRLSHNGSYLWIVDLIHIREQVMSGLMIQGAWKMKLWMEMDDKIRRHLIMHPVISPITQWARFFLRMLHYRIGEYFNNILILLTCKNVEKPTVCGKVLGCFDLKLRPEVTWRKE